MEKMLTYLLEILNLKLKLSRIKYHFFTKKPSPVAVAIARGRCFNPNTVFDTIFPSIHCSAFQVLLLIVEIVTLRIEFATARWRRRNPWCIPLAIFHGHTGLVGFRPAACPIFLRPPLPLIVDEAADTYNVIVGHALDIMLPRGFKSMADDKLISFTPIF